MPDTIRSHLEHVLKWVESPSWYHQFVLPPLRRYQPRLSARDKTDLHNARKFLQCDPRCSVKAFCVPEWEKNRKRPIFWPDINESIAKTLLIPNIIPRKEHVRHQAASSSWSVQFDFASWYDQLPLRNGISRYFSFEGSTCLASLPMGFRPSADVAHVITLAIASFDMPEGVQATVYIDNIRFGGPDASSTAAAAEEFLRRARRVGAIVNEDEIKPMQQEDFLGEHYDLVQKSRQLTDKALRKLTSSKSLISGSLTFRQVAAIFGLLFYCSEVSRVNLCERYEAMRWYRSTVSKVPSWDDTAPACPENVIADIVEWIETLLRNPPCPIVNDELPDPDITIYCDASEQGWGAVVVSPQGTRHISSSWTTDDRRKFRLGFSTVAEPLAVSRAVAMAIDGGRHHVRVMSDHQGLIFAGNMRYGKCKAYNDMCQSLLKYTHTTFSFGFIPGALNTIADRLSREGPFNTEEFFPSE